MDRTYQANRFVDYLVRSPMPTKAQALQYTRNARNSAIWRPNSA